MVSCEYCEIFKNSFFIEHLWWLLTTDVFTLISSLLPWNFRAKENLKRNVKIFSETFFLWLKLFKLLSHNNNFKKYEFVILGDKNRPRTTSARNFSFPCKIIRTWNLFSWHSSSLKNYHLYFPSYKNSF